MPENQLRCTFNVVLTQFGPFILFLKRANGNDAYVEANKSISTSNEAWHCRNLIDLSLSLGVSSLRLCLQDKYSLSLWGFFFSFFFFGMPWGGGLTPFVLDLLNFSVLTSKHRNPKWSKGLLSTTVTPESRVLTRVCMMRFVVNEPCPTLARFFYSF